MSKINEIEEKLDYLQQTKTLLKEAIVAKGGVIAEDAEFRDYVGSVEGISTGVPINNQDKTITENGTYTADEGYTGLGTVTVDVASSGGGSLPSAKRNDVTFIDYDGTVLYSYSTEEAQKLNELPPLPEHDGLICQGWNYDLATIKEYNRPVTVGAIYTTDDGKTRVYITLQEGRTSPMLGVCPKGTVTIDWGDGTEPDILTGTSTSTVKWTPTHNYAEPGDYVISLTVDGTMVLGGSSSYNQYSYLLRHTSGSDGRNRHYQNAIQKLEIGEGVISIGNNAFDGMYHLTSVNIPESVTSFGGATFTKCYSLTSVNIPESVTSFGGKVFENCYSLTSVSIPEGITSIESMFQNCYSLTSVNIPESVTSFGYYVFQSCYSFASVIIPKSVTSIGYDAFSGCYGIKFYDFTEHTAVPTLSATSTLSGISADCEIRVPAALYDEWIAATNWSTYASQIVAV